MKVNHSFFTKGGLLGGCRTGSALYHYHLYYVYGIYPRWDKNQEITTQTRIPGIFRVSTALSTLQSVTKELRHLSKHWAKHWRNASISMTSWKGNMNADMHIHWWIKYRNWSELKTSLKLLRRGSRLRHSLVRNRLVETLPHGGVLGQ